MGISLYELNIAIYDLVMKKFIIVNKTFNYENEEYKKIAITNATNIMKKQNWYIHENILILCNSRIMEQKIIYISGALSIKYIKKFQTEDFLKEFTEEYIISD